MRLRICREDMRVRILPIMPTFAQKVAAYRRSLNLTQKAFARLLGVDQPTVSRWESGSDPRGENITKLADLSQMDADYWLGNGVGDGAPARPMIRMPVKAAVNAGAWKEAIEWSQEDQYDVRLPTLEGLPNLDLTGFEVSGPSMNLVYRPGSVIFAAPTITHRIEPLPGARVIVQRRNRDGLFEATCKEFDIDESGQMWLWPRSTHPKHQEPIQPKPDESSDVMDCQVTGIVLASYRIEDLSKIKWLNT